MVKSSTGNSANLCGAERTCPFKARTQHITGQTAAGSSDGMDVYMDNKNVQSQRH